MTTTRETIVNSILVKTPRSMIIHCATDLNANLIRKHWEAFCRHLPNSKYDLCRGGRAVHVAVREVGVVVLHVCKDIVNCKMMYCLNEVRGRNAMKIVCKFIKTFPVTEHDGTIVYPFKNIKLGVSCGTIRTCAIVPSKIDVVRFESICSVPCEHFLDRNCAGISVVPRKGIKIIMYPRGIVEVFYRFRSDKPNIKHEVCKEIDTFIDLIEQCRFSH